MTFWEKLFILFGALWCFMLVFMFYTWKLQQKQQAVLRYIACRLASLERLLSPKADQQKTVDMPKKTLAKKETETPETVITIDKNEPISKYESVNLPDEIDINFVDR